MVKRARIKALAVACVCSLCGEGATRRWANGGGQIRWQVPYSTYIVSTYVLEYVCIRRAATLLECLSWVVRRRGPKIIG
ncbi:hypothetical protein COCSADRAFT_238227 [Bipolaris sorokiniana ND90Pr]|uniref:Secreted protein n=1 Tax=Cochliobolus sativus (strain ND90Pr / ATCC 201652) TaxID=665912 RepID=M2SVY0_COCSN|nr:uncharacterized protein COCSADRAFT_238227 [Bipolaris sorokiniana ND90Pr]EMD60997.1 hypothetical protein COCSADRAFT_238227 [Bipolaris sorokiniana ND90Pr]